MSQEKRCLDYMDRSRIIDAAGDRETASNTLNAFLDMIDHSSFLEDNFRPEVYGPSLEVFRALRKMWVHGI